MAAGAIVPAVLGALLQRALPNIGAAIGLGPPPGVDKEALRRIKPILEAQVQAGHTDAIEQNRQNLLDMGLTNPEINIYSSAAKGFKPMSKEDLAATVGGITQVLQGGQGGPATRAAGAAPQMITPAQVEPLTQGVQPEGVRTTPLSLYGGEGEQAPTLAPETQMEPQAIPSPSAFQLPRLPSEQQAEQQSQQQYPVQSPSELPLTEAPPLPSRPRPVEYGVTDVEVTPQGQFKGLKIGRKTPTEREAETAQEITRLMDKENMSLRDAMENARGRGFTMDNAAWTQFGQRAFRQTFQKRLQNLGEGPQNRLLAALLAEQEVGSEYADPTLRKSLDELRDNPASDPTTGRLLSDLIELYGKGTINPNTKVPYSQSEVEAMALRITGGKSLEKMGIRLPSERARTYGMQSIERQSQLLETPIIRDTPEGPQAIRPTTGQAIPLPKPPLPDKIIDEYAGANAVIKQLDNLTNKYDAMVRATGGKLSDKLRHSLAANNIYQIWKNYTGKGIEGGQTKEEQEFAAAYNSFMGSLKKLNPVPGSFSDREAIFALQTLGNAARGYGNFHAQQRATKKARADEFNEKLNAVLAGGRYDPGRVRPIDPNLGETYTMPDGTEGVWAGDWAIAGQLPPPKGFKPGWITRQQFGSMPR